LRPLRHFETDDDFGKALEAVSDLTPQQCRESAATRFPIRKSTLGYIGLYTRILDGETLD